MNAHNGIHPEVGVGHVHLRVADLDRAVGFYRDVLGFYVTAYGPDFGLPGVAFLSAGGYHHHIGLNTWTSKGGEPPPEGYTGLYHFALV
jgi:catechol 2,3-dioxygenase